LERLQKELEKEEHQKFTLKVEKLIALINQPRDEETEEVAEPKPSAIFGRVFSGEAASSSSANNNNIYPALEPIHLKALVEGGDIIIDATSSSTGKVLIRYQVASQVLWSASQVFQKMVGPDSQFKEAIDVRQAERGNDPAVIPLYDEPEALELILKTLHHHNDELPDTIPLEQLAEIAVICDKYELHHAFRFVAKMWSGRPVQPLDGSEEWVLISWVFGYEDKFTAASKYLIMFGVRKDDSSKDDWRTMLSDATPEAVTSKPLNPPLKCRE
jgi:hypothetical protein